MSTFKIQGGTPLKGTVKIGGAKNAVLPILAATLLTEEVSTLKNVPELSDVSTFLTILETLGVSVTRKEDTVTIDPKNLKKAAIEHDLVKHMRASILLLGPLLGRFNEVNLAFPGGCVLGKRSVGAHLHAFKSLGASIEDSTSELHLKGPLKAAKFIMSEASVTATENAIMTAVSTEGESEIRFAAMEPHVQDLCHFLVCMGADIQGIGTHTLKIKGGKKLSGCTYSVTPDYLEAGTMVLAAILTNGDVTVENCPVDQLDSFWQKLTEVGANFTLEDNKVHIKPAKKLRAPEKLQTAVYPGFPTDLQAPFTVLLTQCEGNTPLYETLFEGRLGYIDELIRMGAKAEILNPHQALIHGPTPLKGAHIFSHDIRAGAAMVLAAIVAKGESIIHDINYIDRGYEKLEYKLRGLGLDIDRVKD